MQTDEINIEQIEKFLAKHGPRGAKVLSLLGKDRPFHNAITSEIGQELLKDIMTRMEVLLEKIIQSKASEEEKVEYRVTRNIFDRFNTRISNYLNRREKIKNA